MKTACPHCDTVFTITDEQLDLADGMVRCGVCDEVFSALVQDDLFVENTDETAGFVNDEYRQELDAEVEGELPALDAETEADTPALLAADDSATTINLLAATGTEDEETQRIDDEAGLFDGGADYVVPDDIRYGDRPSLLVSALWGIGCLALLLVLVMQFAWLQREQLAQEQSLRPWLQRLCQQVDCDRLKLRDPGRMEMTSRNVYTHPTVDDALMVSITLVNRAGFAQPYPDIKIDFSDIVGTVIASRRLQPHEYLSLDTSQVRMLEPEAPVSFGIGIRDPGNRALTYEFEFL